jgi:hypothetical protein
MPAVVETTEITGRSAVGATELTGRSAIAWSAVFAGAVAGAGLAAVLDAFGAAIGLAVSSTAPTWRDASFALAFLSGLYLVLAALVSYGVGAYVAARLRPAAVVPAGEREIKDGYHGLIVWGLMTVATVILLAFAATALPRLAAPSGAGNGPATSVAGENIIALDLDRLFRDQRPTRAPVDMSYVRAEAARILLTTSSHRGMLAEDRTYLVRLVERTTGLPAAEAETRVNQVAASAKQNIDRARNSGTILAFMIAAAALLGAVAAWFASVAGGRERDGIEPVWDTSSVTRIVPRM